MFFRTKSTEIALEPLQKLRKIGVEAADAGRVAKICELFIGSGTDVILAAIRGWPEMSESDRTAIISIAVACENRDCLRAMVRPVDEGGLGWDLNVRNEKGESPVNVAAKHKLPILMKELLQPVDKNGFGVKIDKASLRSLFPETGIFPHSAIRYRRTKLSKADRQFSFIEYQGQRFVRNGLLGQGKNGLVSRFTSKTDPNHHLAVKQPLERLKAPVTDVQVLVGGNYSHLELSVFHLAYPELKPFGLQHYVNAVPNKETKVYDCRVMMPVIEGQNCDVVVNTLQNPIDLMKLILAITIEVNRIHGLGVVHGDLKLQNILVAMVKAADGQIDTFKVTCIDFEFAGYIGNHVDAYLRPSVYLAPERLKAVNPEPVAASAQDVYSWAYMVAYMLECFKRSADEEAKLELFAFPSVNIFIVWGLKENPNQRPQLIDFINTLQSEVDAAMKPVDLSRSLRMK